MKASARYSTTRTRISPSSRRDDSIKYMASSESDADVGDAIMRVHRCVDSVVVDLLARSSLAEIDATLVYVPIIMPAQLQVKYKERSRLVAKKRPYECCPQLEYSCFLGDDLVAHVAEYLRGLSTAAPHLHSIGADTSQQEEFLSILRAAAERALMERRDIARQ